MVHASIERVEAIVAVGVMLCGAITLCDVMHVLTVHSLILCSPLPHVAHLPPFEPSIIHASRPMQPGHSDGLSPAALSCTTIGALPGHSHLRLSQ